MALSHQVSTTHSFWFSGYFIYTGLVGEVSEYCKIVLAITGVVSIFLATLKMTELSTTLLLVQFGFLILWAKLYFPDTLYPGTSQLETKQEDVFYGQSLIRKE